MGDPDVRGALADPGADLVQLGLQGGLATGAHAAKATAGGDGRVPGGPRRRRESSLRSCALPSAVAARPAWVSADEERVELADDEVAEQEDQPDEHRRDRQEPSSGRPARLLTGSHRASLRAPKLELRLELRLEGEVHALDRSQGPASFGACRHVRDCTRRTQAGHLRPV